jgi:hypothetical protein
MKYRFVIIIALGVLPLLSFSQSLLVGGGIGTNSITSTGYYVSTLEGKLKHNRLFSICFDPALSNYRSELSLTLPLYLKANIGDDFRFCPIIGGYTRSYKKDWNYVSGWTVGFIVEYDILEKSTLFIKSELMTETWDSEDPHPRTGQDQKRSLLWWTLGYKINLL